MLEGLVHLAVDLLRDHLRLADGELEALAPHLLDEDGEGELAAALHLPGVGAADVDDLQRDVADELAVEPVLHHAGGQLVTLDLADDRRGVRADRHRDRGVVDVDRRERSHVLRVGEGLADGDLLDAGDGDDVAGARVLGGEALDAFVFRSSVMRTFEWLPSWRTQATVWPFLMRPLKTRSRARRPRNGEESRFVTQACSGASSS